jgi:hypothetical protein
MNVKHTVTLRAESKYDECFLRRALWTYLSLKFEKDYVLKIYNLFKQYKLSNFVTRQKFSPNLNESSNRIKWHKSLGSITFLI